MARSKKSSSNDNSSSSRKGSSSSSKGSSKKPPAKGKKSYAKPPASLSWNSTMSISTKSSNKNKSNSNNNNNNTVKIQYGNRQWNRNTAIQCILPPSYKSVTPKRSNYNYNRSNSNNSNNTPLKLPYGKPVSLKSVPWGAPEYAANNDNDNKSTTAKATNKKTAKSESLPSDNVPAHFLQRLDQELYALANYLRLSPNEIAIRNHWVQHVEQIAREQQQQQQEIHLQVFGSFATPSVATFSSDVDLVLWGIVAPPPVAIASSSNNNNATATNATPATTASGTTLSTKESLKRKWEQALESVEPTLQSSNAKSPPCTDAVIEEEHVDEHEDSTLTSSNKNLYTIDRVGFKNDNDSNMNDVVKVTTTTATMTVSKTTHSSTFENVIDLTDSHSVSSEAPQKLDSTNANHENHNTVIDLCNSDDDNSNGNHYKIDDNANHDDDNDSADKLNGLPHQFDSVSSREEKRQLAAKRDNDNKDLFVAMNSEDEEESLDQVKLDLWSSPTMTPIIKLSGSKGRVKASVVDALTSLSRPLRKSALTRSLQVIKNARVPIIKIVTSLGFETDVGIGGHNGCDTSHFAAAQAKKYASFSVVVLVLKMMMEHQDLDKPFTGGLGSYKLYVLLANHISKHLALGGQDRPGEILLTFLFRYGNISGFNASKQCKSPLIQNSVVHYDASSSADLSNVYQLHKCTDLFSRGWDRLLRRSKENDTDKSILVDLIDTKVLQRERVKCKAMAEECIAKFDVSIPNTTTDSVHSSSGGSDSRSKSKSKRKRRRTTG